MNTPESLQENGHGPSSVLGISGWDKDRQEGACYERPAHMLHSACKASANFLDSRVRVKRSSPGVKTPDSLRALKMDTARAVRLGSLEEKK